MTAPAPRPPVGLRVVSLDLDGTLIHPAIFNAVADALGFGDALRPSFEAYLKGEMTIPEAFAHDFPYFVGRRVDELREVLRSTDRWTPGIGEAVARFHDAGLKVIVTTDQPRFLAEATQELFGVDELVCTECSIVNGRVTADVKPEFEKWPNLERWLRAKRVPPSAVAHVGNGSNDIPVFARVGFSIAVNHEKEAVARAARHAIPRLADLGEVADVLLPDA